MLIYYIIIVSFLIFLYYGYRDDCNRNKNAFKIPVFSIFIVLAYSLICYKAYDGINVFFKTKLMELYPSELDLENLKNMSSKEIEKIIVAHKKYEGKIEFIIDAIDVLIFSMGFFYYGWKNVLRIKELRLYRKRRFDENNCHVASI
jgi:hypothetical protein